MKVFTATFWISTLEATLVSATTAFGGSLFATSGPGAKNFAAAGIAGGMAALYTFTKQLGAVQMAAPASKTLP